MGSGDRRATPRFAEEIYWFVVIALGGVLIGTAVLPPKTSEILELLDTEHETAIRVEDLRERERVLDAAIDAARNDPFYRRGILRNRLGLTRKSEEKLELPPPPFPITPVPGR